METGGSPIVVMRKAKLTPKAIINQRYSNKAFYKVEEVQESVQNGCPGLAIPQKGPSLYRCSLELPDCFVVSDVFKKKKDAEQSAAEMALKKLGIHITDDNLTEQEMWDALVDRIRYLFSDEFLPCVHPLSGHLRAALRREGDLSGSIPASVIAACDAKLSNLCKLLNSKVETNPFLALFFIMGTAARLSGSVVTSKGQFSIQKQNPYPPEIIESSDIQQSDCSESIYVQAVYIPSALDKAIQPLNLHVSSSGYYLDVIAEKLGVMDPNKVLLSRTIGKASSEARLYFAAPESFVLDLSLDLVNVKEVPVEGTLNVRASYFPGQFIYGDAIMASIGYTWRSKDLFYEDVSLQFYYRMLVSKTPCGNYKLSREAIFAADLPSVFTTKTNWRGSFPREVLCTFCRQHRLSEPAFSTINIPLNASSELSRSHESIEDPGQETGCTNGTAADDKESATNFRCEVKIFSKFQELILKCSPKEIYKKQTYAIHNGSLKILLWLNTYFKDPTMPLEKLKYSADDFSINFYPEIFYKEFGFCASVHNVQHAGTHGGRLPELKCLNMTDILPAAGVFSMNIEGSDFGVCGSNGSLLCIDYSVSLVTEGENIKELLERNCEFEFEMGSGAVISPLEAVVTQLSVGQSVSFRLDLPSQEFVLAAANDSGRILSLLSSSCCLEYCVTLLRVTEPPEERMEQALFSPPLSKQRVEFALQHIRKSSATTLIDFGCGSGSLLDSLLDYPTSLEKIVGIDISQKSLSRAAKIMRSKLCTNSEGIKSAILYDGSITNFNPLLCGFDIGTCLEVIEHMEEDQAQLFGNMVLRYFRPKILIVSTPNYEYNVILQRSSLTSQEEDPDEKTDQQSCKFRNHDHKFEWTREQFNHWASELAKRHNYTVEFSGVGGSGDVEPGFASQIAVFKREIPFQEDDLAKYENSTQDCKVIWEWNSTERLESNT